MKKLIMFLMAVSFTATAVAQEQEINLEQVNEKLDGAYEKVTLKEREIIPYDHLRESDIKWQKRVWRVIDFKEKINLPFIHPQRGLVKLIHDAAARGEIQVYAISEKGETFQEAMSPQDVAGIGVSKDTITRTNIETGEEEPVVTETQFNPEDVTKMRLKEDWMFDIESSTMIVRILGISLVKEKFGEDGTYQGDVAMYWIYYPDLRPILAQAPVYNIQNDANTTSWEDILEMRYFSSYIMKISNTYNRRIQDYATGLDILYESDKFQNEIRNYENDLWEF